MKKVLIISALGAMFMASCADEFDQTYKVGRPDMTAEYAYLEAYEPLKEYVDNSDFHLGLAVAAPDYNKQEPGLFACQLQLHGDRCRQCHEDGICR